jgi:hypothetical protein
MTPSKTRPSKGGNSARKSRAGEKPDQLKKIDPSESRQEALIDESLEETFPASDSPTPKALT